MSWFNVYRRDAKAIVSIFDDIGTFDTGTADLARELEGVTEIELVVDSLGGGTLTALAVVDLVRGRCPVAHIRRAHSSGMTIALAADRRIARSNASLMIHRAVDAVVGNEIELRLASRRVRAVNNRLRDHIAERTGQPMHVVKGWLKRDTYFSPAEALAAGLVHEIVEPPPEITPAAESVEPASALTPCTGPTPEEVLLLDLLQAVGPVRTHDRKRLMRELGAWAAYNVKEG